MADNDTPVLGTALMGIGATATAVGGLGVGFRAAGLGYLGQSLLALVIGIALLTLGLKLAARQRRAEFASLAPARVAVAYSAPSSWATAPERVRVPAWTTPMLELPPARAA